MADLGSIKQGCVKFHTRSYLQLQDCSYQPRSITIRVTKSRSIGIFHVNIYMFAAGGGPHTKVTERIRLGGQLVVSPESKQLRETDDGSNPGVSNARLS